MIGERREGKRKGEEERRAGCEHGCGRGGVTCEVRVVDGGSGGKCAWNKEQVRHSGRGGWQGIGEAELHDRRETTVYAHVSSLPNEFRGYKRFRQTGIHISLVPSYRKSP